MHIDGVNGKLSDIDYYDTVLTSVEQADFVADIGAPLYFKRNTVFQALVNFIAPENPNKKGTSKGGIRDAYLSVLDEILKLFDMRATSTASITTLLQSLKNALIGKVHLPHAPMIDNGLHAITLEGAWSKNVKKNKEN